MKRSVTLAALVLAIGACAAEEPEPFLAISGPGAFERIELRGGLDEREVIWLLLADPPVALSELVYARVPAGFRQVTPESGTAPRPLLGGESLVLRSTTSRRVFLHWGFASGSSDLSITGWETRLRDRHGAPGERGVGLGALEERSVDNTLRTDMGGSPTGVR